jgi:GNAT superfamily N-acetyltransferase
VRLTKEFATMPAQPLWAYERGVLWALDLESAPPATSRPSTNATFTEATPEDAGALAAAMSYTGPEEVQRRSAAGSRCFVARIGDAIAAYGWVSQGEERIGELERLLRMRPGEAYIWDCATLEPYRRQGLYSALLVYIVAMLRREGLRRIWIGASLQNRPSLKGFANAGFQPVITILYARLLGLSHSWLVGVANAPPALVADARQALTNDRSPHGIADRVRSRSSP